jgi:heme/copper-type cytochrome/quinol oxidase subunit 2
MFIFGITKDGKPVTDLQNYLGAKGHAVILKEGTLDYIHAHPSDHGGGHGGMVMPGPGEVIFMASLLTPGRYRVFQQYRPEGHLITVANTYEVVAPPSDISTDTSAEGDFPTQEFSVEAFQWGFSPNVIRVKEGTRLMLHLTTRDVPHGFSLADFDVSETILPGKTTIASFVADKNGTFTFGCDIACGSGHPGMAKSGGTLIVE